MKKIHDAGVVHGGFGVSDILIANMRPFIVNFKNAEEKACERKLDIMEGAAAPKREQFGCTELYRHCVDLQIWKPRTLLRPDLIMFGRLTLFHRHVRLRRPRIPRGVCVQTGGSRTVK